MSGHISRRSVLKSGAAFGAALGLGDLAFLRGLPPVQAEETKLDPAIVRLDPGIEPLVRLLESTPRDRVLEEFGSRIKAGLSYRDVLAALLLAGVRNVEPRPQVGFKFHAVLVVNSAHLASIASPPEHRWLPIFWALDYFKSSQAADEKERRWTMKPVDEVFRDLKSNPAQAAGKVLALLKNGTPARELLDAARVLIFLKGTDSHDYKFSSAVFEDYEAISPDWRDTYLASNLFNLRGAGDSDNRLVERTRAALGS